MNITDKMLKAVAFLGIKKDGRFLPRATCFFVNVLTDQHEFSHLITAEHVVSGLLTKGHTIWLRMNAKNGGTCEYRLDPSEFYYHPDAEKEPTDVAVLPVASITLRGDDPEPDISIMQLFGEGSFLPSAQFRKEYMGRGGEIAIIGLFRNHAGQNRNIPIIRAGHIAAIPSEPVWTKQGAMEAYLVEAQSIAGLSGSPALALPDNALELAKGLTKHIIPAERAQGGSLLGLVVGHFDVPNLNEDVVSDSDSSNGSVHTGIGVVVPVEKIMETLEQPDLIKRRREIISRLREESGAVLDLASDEGDAPPSSDVNPKHREDFTRLLNAAAKTPPQED